VRPEPAPAAAGLIPALEMLKTLGWLRPATLAATIVAAGSVLAPAPVQAQDVTVLRGSPSRPSPSRPYASVDCNNPDYYQYCQDNQSSNYTPYSYGNDYPYYGDDFAVGVGRRRFSHRGGFHGGGFHAGGLHGGGLHGGGFQGGGFQGGGFQGGGFQGGGFQGGGFHGGGGHR
jgi:hypothetical protein